MSDASAVVVSAPRDELLTRLQPVDIMLLANAGLSETSTMVELRAGSELCNLVCAYAVKHLDSTSKAYGLEIGRASHGEKGSKRTVEIGLGLGLNKFVHEGLPVYALLQTLGQPVGSDCGAVMYTSLVLVSPRANDIEFLRAMCEYLIREADHVQPDKFTIWRWHLQHQYWMRGQVVTARPIESVVLPKATEELLLQDIDEFLEPGTCRFYAEHGIPHKRSYLFHGPPGAGKTSAIQAVAGKYGFNVAYLSGLSHPDMTDDSLKSAMERVPTKSIIVLEDIDALWEEGRRTKKAGDKSALTFSGMLNALDGVGGAVGQIFVLTTNHRERLDPALIRNGRVDVHIEFADATADQMRGLFMQFYKDAPDALATEFESALKEQLGPRSVSMAALQSYFILMRKQSAETAIKSVHRITEEMDQRITQHKADEHVADKSKEDKSKEDKSKADGEEASDADDAEANGKKDLNKSRSKERQTKNDETHVHIHVHKS